MVCNLKITKNYLHIDNYSIYPLFTIPVGKIVKKEQSEGVRFCYFGTQNTVQN